MTTVEINGEQIPVEVGQVWRVVDTDMEILAAKGRITAYWINDQILTCTDTAWGSTAETLIKHRGFAIDLAEYCYLWPDREEVGEYCEGMEYGRSDGQ